MIHLLLVECVPPINVGIVTDPALMPDGAVFLQSALADFTQHNTTSDIIFSVQSDSTRGCRQDVDSGAGAALIAELYFIKGIKALFGPICQNGLTLTNQLVSQWDLIEFSVWSDSTRRNRSLIVQMSTMSTKNLIANLIALLKGLNRTQIALIWSPKVFPYVDAPWSSQIDIVRQQLSDNGIQLLVDKPLYAEENSTEAITAMLLSIKHSPQIFVPLIGFNLLDYVNFMMAFKSASMNFNEYAVILTVFAINGNFVPPWILSNGKTDQTLKHIYDNSIILLNDFYDKEAVELINARVPNVSNEMQLLAYLQIYESVWLYATQLQRFRRDTTNTDYTNDSVQLLNGMRNLRVDGPFGPIVLNNDTVRISPFSVRSVQRDAEHPVNLMSINLTENCPLSKIGQPECVRLRAAMADNTNPVLATLPPDVPNCGLNGELCDQTGKSGETAQMPWAIPQRLIKFVDLEATTSLMSIHSLQQHMESKAKLRDLLRSRQLATIEQSYVIIEPYILKQRLVFDKSDMLLLYQMKQAVHDNINAFIGISFDKMPQFYATWKHCFRGTLADLIFGGVQGNDPNHKLESEDGPAFDQNFKSAFVRDIVRGLDFLHSSSIGYHGSLTPSQCLIDSHWILKISGFGLARMMYKWKQNGAIATHDGLPFIPNSELHYYAPELRRRLKTLKKDSAKLPNKQGQAADMYAFGMILYEIVFRRKPVYIDDSNKETAFSDEEQGLFCEAAEALIPIYPSMPNSEDIHPDLVGLMHKCWNGVAEQRPDATLARKITDATLKMTGSLVDQMLKNMEQYTNNLENLVKERTSQLEQAQQHAERLLLELLPKCLSSVADELKVGRRVDAKNFKSATILYSDIVGFTSLCSESEPMEVVQLLSGVFRKFDLIISMHKCYKVETIGDAYMVTSGVPIPSRHNHVRDIASVAIMMRDYLFEYKIPHRPNQNLHCRWGFNTGPVFAGVVGLSAPRYCVFGATATLASKMENSGMPDRIQMTLKSYQLLSARFPEYRCSPRGGVRIEGFGTLLTYWLEGCEELLKSDHSGNADLDDVSNSE
ncbi:unnamed protein product [Anisakis simplex]|uniref:guanylate cyclase n=1 Tax=Anisakis simplex TaxID=6269 RepID=A0A0M3JWW9_ANISI|nr:unnamed protein product [Anisakis simplex]